MWPGGGSGGVRLRSSSLSPRDGWLKPAILEADIGDQPGSVQSCNHPYGVRRRK